MDSEDDGDDELNVIEEFFQHSIRSDIPEQFKTYVEHFQRFLSQQTITYIQYCLLRIPFLLAYDYLFTDQFSSLINSFLKYSIDIIDKEHRILFKPITYILKSYFFEYLIYLNVILSLPVLGKIFF
ncbi:unnamed protein product [Rotaria magnacalcarata]|uniref:Uncharacterized protein n=1 Tax=Rotaria magnacalcarata TaxID=392030 RepID=A0A8S3JHJ4_9BILA|nr:unnamed protein product [Rotaria magnacalcarata]